MDALIGSSPVDSSSLINKESLDYLTIQINKKLQKNQKYRADFHLIDHYNDQLPKVKKIMDYRR